MKRILVKDCMHCPLMSIEVKDFFPPYPLILYQCIELELKTIAKGKLKGGYIDEECPLEDSI